MTDDERAADAEARPIDGHELLERLAALPVATWRYHWEPPHVRHLGPMSQDFRAALAISTPVQAHLPEEVVSRLCSATADWAQGSRSPAGSAPGSA